MHFLYYPVTARASFSYHLFLPGSVWHPDTHYPAEAVHPQPIPDPPAVQPPSGNLHSSSPDTHKMGALPHNFAHHKPSLPFLHRKALLSHLPHSQPPLPHYYAHTAVFHLNTAPFQGT